MRIYFMKLFGLIVKMEKMQLGAVICFLTFHQEYKISTKQDYKMANDFIKCVGLTAGSLQKI